MYNNCTFNYDLYLLLIFLFLTETKYSICVWCIPRGAKNKIFLLTIFFLSCFATKSWEWLTNNFPVISFCLPYKDATTECPLSFGHFVFVELKSKIEIGRTADANDSLVTSFAMPKTIVRKWNKIFWCCSIWQLRLAVKLQLIFVLQILADSTKRKCVLKRS